MKKVKLVKAGLIALLFAIILILPFTAVVYKLTAQIDKEIVLDQKKIHGLEYHALLRKLLENVQQHRDIVNAYLSGDDSVKGRLLLTQNQAENVIGLLDKANNKFGKTLKTTEEWAALKTKWQILKNEALRQSDQVSFEAHTALIADIISLSIRVGDTSNLILDPFLDSYHIMDAVVTKLPSTIENIAQVRSLGTEILVRKTIKAEEKAQLSVLSSLIKLPTDTVDRGIKVAFRENSRLVPQLEVYARESIVARDTLLNLLDQRIIKSSTTTITPSEYFTVGTEALAAYFKLYDVLSPTLNNLLQQRIVNLSRNKDLIQFSALLILVIIIYALAAFAHNLTKRKRAEEEVRLLQTMSQAISEAEDFHSALEVALRKVCQFTGWHYGEAWIPNAEGTALECSPAWYTSDQHLEKFRKLSEQGEFTANVGLPGRVWLCKQPEWIQDVSLRPETVFFSEQITQKGSLKSGLGLPIIANTTPSAVSEARVLAVLIFFTLESHEEDKRMVQLVSAVAAQLGSVLGRKAAEEALRLAEEKYRKIFENATEGIFQTTPEGRYLSANPALAQLYGYSSPEEMIAELQDIAQQIYLKPIRRTQFIKAVEKHGSVSRFRSQVYRKNGSIIWISENARAVRDANGKLLYYEGTIEDITDRKVAEEALRYQQEQSELLLLNILPGPIAARLRLQERTIADSFSEVTVMFADIVGFTELSADIPAVELVELLNKIFSKFDQLVERHELEKIKTIGDAYMVVGGLPLERDDHAEAIAEMALDIQQSMSQFNIKNGHPFSIRIGINTGPVIAGVIGIKKFTYDLWGDTVNTASRMESHGLAGCIQVTATTYERLKDKYIFEERGVIQVKGKGEMMTYLLIDRVVGQES